MSAGLLALALLAIKPLPGPADLRAGQQATGCIYYYRLQSTFLPGGSRACEAEGYGLAFMRARWKQIDAREAARRRLYQAELEKGRKEEAARARRAALRGPCFAMVLDGGRGPDGGAALCNLAGFTHDMVTRTARHEAFLARRRSRVRRRKRMAVPVALGVFALLFGSGLVLALVGKKG